MHGIEYFIKHCIVVVKCCAKLRASYAFIFYGKTAMWKVTMSMASKINKWNAKKKNRIDDLIWYICEWAKWARAKGQSKAILSFKMKKFATILSMDTCSHLDGELLSYIIIVQSSILRKRSHSNVNRNIKLINDRNKIKMLFYQQIHNIRQRTGSQIHFLPNFVFYMLISTYTYI